MKSAQSSQDRYDGLVHTVFAPDGVEHEVSYRQTCAANGPDAAAHWIVGEFLASLEEEQAHRSGVAPGASIAITLRRDEEPPPGEDREHWTLTILLDQGNVTMH